MESRGIKEEERCGRGGRVEAKSSGLPRGDEHSLSRGISSVLAEPPIVCCSQFAHTQYIRIPRQRPKAMIVTEIKSGDRRRMQRDLNLDGLVTDSQPPVLPFVVTNIRFPHSYTCHRWLVKLPSSLQCQRILLASHLQTLPFQDDLVPFQTHLVLRPPEAMLYPRSLTAPASLSTI
jgi:hypothetical protein